jgi:citrate synthase
MSDSARTPGEAWATGITDTAPGIIRIRGYPIGEIIDRLSYAGTVWLTVTGELPTPWQERLLNAALVAGIDHGPQAPSIAAARMAATCGVGLSQAVATGVNMLGDIHGGAGQNCMEFLEQLRREQEASDAGESAVVSRAVARYRQSRRFVPGFGHRMHTRDPRRDPLLGLVESAVADGAASGEYLRIATALERELIAAHGKPIPMNVDGATAVVYSELGLAPPLGKGLFALSRSIGLLAHAWEQMQEGARIKGPLPPGEAARYTGPAPRHINPAAPGPRLRPEKFSLPDNLGGALD